MSHYTPNDSDKPLLNPLQQAVEDLLKADPAFARIFVDMENWKPNRPGYRLVHVTYKGRRDSWVWVPDASRPKEGLGR